MGIRSLELVESSTLGTLTLEGSTPLTFAEDGVVIANGVHMICTDDDATTRRQLAFKARPSAYDMRTGSFTKMKNTLSVSTPVHSSDGKMSFTTVRVEFEATPESPTETNVAMLNLAAQAIVAQQAKNFWLLGAKN